MLLIRQLIAERVLEWERDNIEAWRRDKFVNGSWRSAKAAAFRLHEVGSEWSTFHQLPE